jgi:DNA-binding transcriptional LysR family regulator
MRNWDDLKTFLAIARHGNLSAAGRALGVSQTTMGRRLEGLEERTGAKLLRRLPTGFVLTPAGEHILANVERMEAEAIAAERTISGEDNRLDGLVTITTVETFAARVLPGAIALLHETHPAIAIDVITVSRPLNLARREADIAIRMSAFEQHDVVVQRMGSMAFDIYASKRYLERRGLPDWSTGAAGHDIIVMHDALHNAPEIEWLIDVAPQASRCLRADSRAVQISSCAAGLGIACLPSYLADEIVELQLLDTGARPPTRGIWIGVHKDMRQTPRIKAVRDALVTELKQWSKRLNPARVVTQTKADLQK